MAAFLERFGIFARSPDARPLAEIAADIDDELAFHLEQSRRALEAEGLAPEPARAEALRRFGDYGRIRRECARTLMGERIMLQRIQLVLTAALVVVVGLMLWSNREAQAQARAAMVAERMATNAALARLEASLAAPATSRPHVFLPPYGEAQAAATPPPGDYIDADGRASTLEWSAESWLGAFQLQDAVWRHGLKIAERMSALPDAQGTELLARVWSDLSIAHREQVMKPFVFGGGHPYALEVLELGLRDEASSVRERARAYVQTYAWQDLRENNGATAWFAAWRDRPVADVLRENARRWALELATIRSEHQDPFRNSSALALLAVVDEIRPESFAKAGVDLGAILRDAGFGAIADAELASVSDAVVRARVEKLRSWTRAK